MAVVVATASLTTVRLATGNSDGVTRPPRLSFTKPSWIVKTESNVQRENHKIPDPPCVVCKGNGRVDCYHCFGRGRTNQAHLTMLPKGEWPKWCRGCGGSGLSYCSRCQGTGEYRYIMGFRFMKTDSDDTQDSKNYHTRRKSGHSAAYWFLNVEPAENQTTRNED